MMAVPDDMPEPRPPRLILGDCLSVMRGMEAGSVDAVVTDPPYDLTSGNGRGFMSHKWDGTGIAFRVETWAEVLRLLKPGGHLLAFGGTRTHHRLMCAIEDAGFEIRDSIHWVYGCLSEDTELLTENGWEPYHKAIEGCRVVAYNVDGESFEWQPIQEVFVYDYRDTAYRIRSDHTDQLVSRNHRCLVERGGSYAFEVAEEAARQREASVPVLEDVRGLLQALPVPEQSTSDSESDVFSGVCIAGIIREGETADVRQPPSCHDRLRGLRQESPEAEGMAQEGGSSDLFSPMQWGLAGSGMGQVRLQGPVGLDRGIAGVLSVQDDWREQPGLEGRGDDLQDARQLRRGPLCPLPAGVPGDGPQGRLCDGASSDRCEGDGPALAEDGSGPSRRPRSDEQPAREPATLRQQQRPQTVRASRFARPDLATIEPVYYEGVVWCVRVPSGAFVARRNGKAFITGNSGFPKSLDISKAIDKAMGAEREVVGVRKRRGGPSGMTPDRGWNDGPMTEDDSTVDVTFPATPEAAKWAGWGTALKPAHEPIVLARNPLDGTVAANVMEHGVGGMNIDACRVAIADIGNDGRAGPGKYVVAPGDVYEGGWSRDSNLPAQPHAGSMRHDARGRWPSNICLTHSASCRPAGTRKVRGSNRPGKDSPTGLLGYHGGASGTGPHEPYCDPDGTEIVESWLCSDDCPVRQLDEQAGETRDGVAGKRSGVAHVTLHGLGARDTPWGGYGGYGGPSRFFPTFAWSDADFFPLRYVAKASRAERGDINSHPTVKPINLCRWLVRLVTPPGGTILDPFAGSATTLLAAHAEGFDAVGVESDPDYYAIASARLAAAAASTPLFSNAGT